MWQQPKINWNYGYDADGNYTGDYFEPADYNRIKNNLDYLKSLTEELYAALSNYTPMGADATYGSTEPMASDFVKLQGNLTAINNLTVQIDIGLAAAFAANQPAALKDELNRLETAEAWLYNILMGQRNNKMRLAVRLGNSRGVRC